MQLRAFIRAAAGRDLARDGADGLDRRRIQDGARACSIASSPGSPAAATSRRAPVSLGVMVEVPSLLWQIDEIAAAADFLSVGSNDLMQYLYAVDRDNKRVADRFDPLSVGFLRALARDRRGGRAQRNAGDAVRRDRRAAARGDGADGDRLPRPLDVGDLDRSGQGDDADARRRRGRARGRGDAGDGARRRPRSASRCCALAERLGVRL